MTVEQEIDEQNDQFPVGMRVLAVDDDPTCLMLLETLLRKCQYHVTTTSQAITALKMLRENRNKFDLVISDVHMPDIDGFKLLELVGLEMDLPVIMLSAYGDTKLVMKGISHGACDYLLKPVRIEELKNIWQHVIRRKKFDAKDQKNSDKAHFESGEVGEGFPGTGDSDKSGKLNRKRKDQNVDEDEERDENGQNIEDPSTQKKPRVVWSVELHRKFVAAVHQLGIDKAVPKRILELMNVDKLSRENVASHLQKYRLYLKRISCVASQQASMVAALGSSDSTYLRMSSLNGLGDLRPAAGSRQFQNAAFGSFSPSSVIGRLNTPAGLGMRGLSSSGTGQLGFTQNSSNPINDLANFHSVIQTGNQNGNILQGLPLSLGLDQLQHNKVITQIGELNSTANDSMVHPISNGFSDMKINVGSSRNSLLGVPNNAATLQGHLQNNQRAGIFGNHSSVADVSLDSKLSSPLLDFGRCNDNWPSAVQSSEVQSDSFTLRQCFKQATPSDLRGDVSSMAMHIMTNPRDVSSIISVVPDTGTDLPSRAEQVSSNAGQNMDFALKQGWYDPKEDAAHHSNLTCISMNSSIYPDTVVGPYIQRSDARKKNCHTSSHLNVIGQSNCLDHPLVMQHKEVEQSVVETTLKSNQGYLKEQRKPLGNYAYDNVGSLEDVVSAMMKQDFPKSRTRHIKSADAAKPRLQIAFPLSVAGTERHLVFLLS
ncbi:unnamed protein product [Ilex paraguariensis]|uniref:Two-component response regulator n=1 Tax=Ilex paraguariensis TaxID=185542 RepID=A0ABC8US72_9AQUA